MMRSPACNVGDVLSQAAFLAFVVVVALRPMIAESYDSAGSPFSAALTQISDPTPARTLALDVAILISTAAWLLGRRLQHRPIIRFPAIEWSTALLTIAAAISCYHAGQKRLAINGALDWLCLPILALALADLLRGPHRRRILLAAILGAAVQQAAQGLDQYLTFQQTWETYEQHKDEFWTDQGVQPGDGKIELFERRALSREVQASFPHSNVAASFFLLCALAAAGVMLDRWRTTSRPRSPSAILLALASSVLAAALVAMLPLTGSLGAAIAAAAGILLWILLVAARTWIERNRRAALRLGWTALLLSGAAFVGHGLYHGAFPHMSLTFRWQYWTAAAGMIADHPLTGVGRENFGRHYLQYKPISSPEEVSNPHNFLVQFAADWGMLGLTGAVALLVSSVSALTRHRDPALLGSPLRFGLECAAPPPLGSPDAEPPRGLRPDSTTHAWVWCAALITVLTVLRLPLLGSDNAGFLYYQSLLGALTFTAGFLAFALPIRTESESRGRATAQGAMNPPSDPTFPTTAILVGLFAFLLHEAINFALFVPGSATTFFALLGLALSERQTDRSPEPRALPCANNSSEPRAPVLDTRSLAGRGDSCPGSARRNPAAGARGALSPECSALRSASPLPWMTAALTGAAIFLGLIPVVRSTHALHEARRLTAVPDRGELSDHPAYRAFVRAERLDPLDPTPSQDRTRWLFSLAESIPPTTDASRQYAMQALRLARSHAAAGDPFNVSPRRRLARINAALAHRTGDDKDYRAAIAAAEFALRLYPQSPESLILLADIERQAADGMNAPELNARALQHYRAALEMDGSRPSWARFNRLPGREVERVEQAVAALKVP